MNAAREHLVPARIRQILDEYYRPLPSGIELQVAKYVDLLALWGQKISLTTIRDPEEVVRAHFGESIFALSLGRLPEGRLADVGTGAGFPGLALKLAIPDLSVALIEPNKKKCAFLHEVIRALGLTDVSVVPSPFRSAEIRENSLGSVATRALAIDKVFLSWSLGALQPSGCILLWLGEQDSREVSSSTGWRWGIPRLIPESKRRYILRGAPARP
ncbi:MAG TPA: 16S rRNA (guanine(527)-N(7))-methyltransferase RsmG [Candidatus Acidoferrales bacterium]|nr:16S rRNA (guanine(527)-N(7))-methyltransferase RsmG [Candidatus Acidoferrales bacterium]